jgi:tetratricopeptide (TPR) repeat protein
VGGQGIQDGMYWFQAPNGYFYLDYAFEYLPNKLDMGQYDEEYYTSLTIDGQINTPARAEVDQIFGTHEIKLTKEKFNQVQNFSFQYQGRRPIVSGEFDITMIVTNNVSRTAATFTRNINIPDMSKATTPYITPVLPVRSIESLPEKSDSRVRPFQYGDKVYVPNVPAKVALNGTLIVYHQVIFPEKWKEETGQLSLHYIIRNGEKVESDLTEDLNMPMSDLHGNAIEIGKDLSLAGLPFGSRQLTVELRQNDKVISQSQRLLFSIDAELNQNIWRYSIAIPGYESTSHNLILAQDYMRLKKPQQASALLQEALKENSTSIELIIPLMKIELQNRQYQKVIDLGTPAELKDPRNQELLWLIGWANYGLGKYEDAIPFFQRIRIEDPKKIEVLNILADTYYQMDERAKSLEIVQQSLALKPDQKDILELKKKLESQQ